MKKQNILLIVLGIIVIAGGIWFLNRSSNNKTENNAGLEEKENETIKSEDSEGEGIKEDEEDGDISEENDDEKDLPDQTDQTNSTIEVDKPAPDFNLKTLAGANVSLDDYKGKIVLLNFWTTTCPFCIKEMPDLDKLDKEYEDVVVLAIDVMEEESEVKEYIEGGGYDFDVLLDLDGEVARNYLISAYPTSYFIDVDGTLMGRVVGMLEYEQMINIIDQIKTNK